MPTVLSSAFVRPIVVVVTAVLLCGTALAQPTPTTDADAKAAALFRKGMDLMNAGEKTGDRDKVVRGCLNLKRSQAKKADLSTQFRLAQCYEKISRYATALALMKKVAVEAKAQGKEAEADFANATADKLATTVPRIRIVLAPQTAALAGVEVFVGDDRVARANLGEAMPVDNGKRQVRVEAPGYRSFKTPIRIGDGDARKVRTIEVPALRQMDSVGDGVDVAVEAVTDDSVEAATGDNTEGGGDQAVGAADDAGGGLTGFQTGALVSGGVGVALMVISGLVMIPANDLYAETTDDPNSNLYCDDGGSCVSPAGEAQRADALALGDGATGLFVFGAVAAGIGIILWVADPAGEADGGAGVALGVGVGPGGVVLNGRF